MALSEGVAVGVLVRQPKGESARAATPPDWWLAPLGSWADHTSSLAWRLLLPSRLGESGAPAQRDRVEPTWLWRLMTVARRVRRGLGRGRPARGGAWLTGRRSAPTSVRSRSESRRSPGLRSW